jgi:prevent-host-death family protein
MRSVSDRYSIAEARNNLPRLVRDAEHGKAVELTRRGEPVAMLIGRGEFERLTGRYRAFADAFDDFSKKVNLPELAPLWPRAYALTRVPERSTARRPARS